MKRSLLFITAALSLNYAAHAAPLTVNLSGIEARGGNLYISIQTEDQFMKEEGRGEIIKAPAAGDQTFTYDVPEGVYAVSIWHDDNDNGTFDMGATTGMPLDGWAMHNGLKLRGAPTFDAVSIEVPASGAAVSEAMIYGR